MANTTTATTQTQAQDRPHFLCAESARRKMRDGEVFSFTFGTLAHYDLACFIDNKLYFWDAQWKVWSRLYGCW